MRIEDRQAYVVDGVRTPFGRHRGALAGMRPDDLAALVLTTALERAGVATGVVDEVVFGGANQSGEDNRNVARMAVLLAGLPDTVPGYTVNRLCASSLQAVASAAQQIRTGEADVVVAGGVESMTRAPYVMAKAGTPWAAAPQLFDTALGWRLVNPRMAEVDGGRATISLGDTAEEVALLDGITRQESDAWGARSQTAAATARDAGVFDRDLVPVETAAGTVKVDEVPRATTAEKLASLKPVFRADGIVTAGTSSPIADGAGAVVVASGAAVKAHGLRPRAKVVGAASAGVAPSLMGLGPVPATQKLLGRLGMTVRDLDAVEFNEAFAPQVLASLRRLDLDEDTVNTDGGAIALGHPLGATGIRLVLMLLGRLERSAGTRGLATLCVGVGQGMAMVLERV
jgi:acetyl-CoA acetyltransferase family protein